MALPSERALKIALLHFLLYTLVLVFVLVGAYIFIKLENPDGYNQNWSFGSAVLLTFQILTTIGYGHAVPSTFEGKLFCVFYTLIGIPLFFLVILDIAAYVKTGIICANNVCFRQALTIFRSGRVVKASVLHRRSAGAFYLISLTGLFVLYNVLGAFMFTLYESSSESAWSFYDSFYFCIISLTTVGFGDMSPSNWQLLALTLLYITFGIALAVLFAETVADYARKLHHIGLPVSDSRSALVQLGAKALSVEELLLCVAQHCELDQERLRGVLENLDDLLEATIAAKEKRRLFEDEQFEGNELSPLENGRAVALKSNL